MTTPLPAGANVPPVHEAPGVRGWRPTLAVRPSVRSAGTGGAGWRLLYRGGSWDCPFVVLRTRMAPDTFPGRLGHRGAPWREQDDGWRRIKEPVLSPPSPCWLQSTSGL